MQMVWKGVSMTTQLWACPHCGCEYRSPITVEQVVHDCKKKRKPVNMEKVGQAGQDGYFPSKTCIF